MHFILHDAYLLSRHTKCTVNEVNISWMVGQASPNDTHRVGTLSTYLKADMELASKTMGTIFIKTMNRYSNFHSSKTYMTQHLQGLDKTFTHESKG